MKFETITAISAACLLSFILPAPAQDAPQTNESGKRNEPPAPSYQVRLLEPKRIQDIGKGKPRETAGLNGVIKVGVYGELATQITAEVTGNQPSASQNTKLYLNGVAMEGLEPTIYPPDAVPDADPKPVWVLEFQLARNAQEEENRLAWDALLPTLKNGENDLQIGVGLAGKPPHLGDHKELSFQVAPVQLIWSVIVVGFMLLVLLFIWAVKSGMMREAGPDTAHSLGKSQMAFWGLLVVISFFGVWIISGKMERIPDQVLILMGISGATGLAAVLIGDGKKSAASQKVDEWHKKIAVDEATLKELEAEKESLEKEKAQGQGQNWPAEKDVRLAKVSSDVSSQQKALDKSRGELEILKMETKAAEGGTHSSWFTDIISDASGPSFPRVQLVLWTVVLGMVFIKSVGTTFTMPEFDKTLLMLMGISNGTYLGFKMPEKNS